MQNNNTHQPNSNDHQNNGYHNNSNQKTNNPNKIENKTEIDLANFWQPVKSQPQSNPKFDDFSIFFPSQPTTNTSTNSSLDQFH